MPFCNQNGNFLKNGFSQKIAKNAIFAKNRFFSNWFIWLQRMIYGWKCVPGTFKSHLKPISGIYDVIGAFSRKSIFFDFWTPKIFFVIFVDAEIQNFVDFRSNFSRNVFYYIISLLEKNANNNSTKFWNFSKKCKKKSKNAFQHKIIIFLESVVFVVFVAFLLLKCC